MYKNRLQSFAGPELRELFESNLEAIKQQIHKETENYILNVNEEEYVEHFIGKYSFNPIEARFDEVFVSSYEKEIPAEGFPPMFNVSAGKCYAKEVIVYHVPFAGNGDLLRYKTSTHVLWTEEIYIEENCVCFEIINFRGDPEEIKRESKKVIDYLEKQIEYLNRDINVYNAKLPLFAADTFSARKKNFLQKSDLLASLGVPIKKRDDIPETFAIPKSGNRRKIKPKPEIANKGFKPEPTLDVSVYHEILRTIFDVGKVFERLPATYRNKSEEELRDHLLLYLEPRFEGSATGETFNKTGKTDILIRYENSNVFVAECKFWAGEKSYLKAIDQLLRNLTWRDSKAGVVLFVKNKDFSSVINKVEETTPEHPNYLGASDREEETWLNYRVHIEGDPSREVILGVLLFHIPSD